MTFSHEFNVRAYAGNVGQPGRDNPYLQRGAGVSVDPTAKEPVYGFRHRKVTGARVLKAMVQYNNILFKLDLELKL